MTGDQQHPTCTDMGPSELKESGPVEGDEFLEENRARAIPARSAPATARFVVGTALMLIGEAAIVGGLILFFALKAEVEGLPRYAERIVLLIVLGVSFVVTLAGLLLAGRGAAAILGVVTVVVGVGMMAFGFVELAEPSLRFYAPLGFFVSLAGGFVIWIALDHAKGRIA